MKKAIILLLSLFAAAALHAQDPGELNRQVEVTRDYIPDVGSGVKLAIVPTLEDTVALRPEIEYTSARPNAFTSGLGVVRINPIQISTWGYRRLTPFYLKAGGGLPRQSLLDLYLSSTHNHTGYFGAYVNHTGQYADITNDLGDKVQALDFKGSGGLFGLKRFGRLDLGGGLGYDHREINKYGLFNMGDYSDLYHGKDQRQRYQTFRGELLFGNDFLDTSYVNFRFGAGGYYFQDRFDNAEIGVNAYLELAQRFYFAELYFRGAYDGYWGREMMDGYKNNIATLSPRIRNSVQNVDFSFGLDFVADGTDDSWFFPQLQVKVDLMEGYIVPFVDINGRLVNNGLRNTVLRNPYVEKGLTMENTAEYNFNVGLSGSYASMFSYRLYMGYSSLHDMNFFVNLYADGRTNDFINYTDKGSRLAMGLDLDYRMAGSFSVGLAANAYTYNLDRFDRAAGLPNYDASLTLRYNHMDKFTVDARAKVLGARCFYEYFAIDVGERTEVDPSSPWLYEVRAKTAVDLGLEAAYKFNRTIGVFVAGNNLFGVKVLDFNHYPSVGANVNAGVILSF